VLVVRGDPGVGKTALLGCVAEQASSRLVGGRVSVRRDPIPIDESDITAKTTPVTLTAAEGTVDSSFH
jgi:ABC-type transport system involved in cytochrome c biogenesis ATPase subunit